MDNKLLEETEGVMAEDSYTCFLVALKHKMKQSKHSQIYIAETTDSSPQWINAIIKERIGKDGKTAKASTELQEKICEIFGYNYVDFLRLGKRIIENIPGNNFEDTQEVSQERPSPQVAAKNGHFDPMNSLADISNISVAYSAASASVQELINQYIKAESDMRLWRLIFDMIPVPALVIRDGKIWYQNQQSRAWGHETDLPLAESCLGVNCERSGDCPVRRSAENSVATTGRQRIGNKTYIMQATPLRVGPHEYIIVVATCEASDLLKRRSADKAIS